MRTLFFALTALALCVGVTLAADKKKGAAVAGKIKKVDAKEGTITVTVKVKKEEMDKEFKIAEDTKITIQDGDNKQELVGKKGLENDKLKEGAMVTILEEEGKVKEIKIGAAKKKDK